jgi:hypothetical protein
MDYKKFLEAISKIESSGGQNTEHPVMQQGIHKGQAAIGRYGLMPNTVDELIASEKINLPIEQQRMIKGLSPEEKKALLESNPDMESAIAESMARKVGNNFGNDPDKMAYSWNQGHNIKPDDPRMQDIDKNEYVNKFREAYAPPVMRSPAMRTLSDLERKEVEFQKKYGNK